MAHAPESRKSLKVHGRVQGVGFRWWAQRQGQSLGLRGFVRNCRDGTVELAFAGPSDAVAEMCRRLEDGPSAASVHRLEELAAPDPSDLPEDGFDIAF